MTHFVGAVVVPKGVEDHIPALASILAPFDENLEVEHWIPFDEVVRKEREWWLSLAWTRSVIEFHNNPEATRRDLTEESIEFITVELPKRLAENDREVFSRATENEARENISADMSVRSTNNPNSQWDWYTIGGRWGDEFSPQQGETVASLVARIEGGLFDLVPVLVTDDWYQIDRGHPFGRSSGESWQGWKSKWLALTLQKLSEVDQESTVWYVDFHI